MLSWRKENSRKKTLHFYDGESFGQEEKQEEYTESGSRANGIRYSLLYQPGGSLQGNICKTTFLHSLKYIDLPESISSDINGHNVDEILSRGYGDCVDRAIVVSTLLKVLDISALPVFLGSRQYRPIETELPSPYTGDHCILKVSGKFGDFFVDPGAVIISPG